MDDEPRRGLAQRQGLFQGQQHAFGGHLPGQVPAHHPARTGGAPRGQAAPAPARQGQIRNAADPGLAGGRGAGPAGQPVFGPHGRWVGRGRAGAVRAGAHGAQALLAQPGAQGAAPRRVAFGPQPGPQPAGPVAPGVARKSRLRRSLRRSPCQAAAGRGAIGNTRPCSRPSRGGAPARATARCRRR